MTELESELFDALTNMVAQNCIANDSPVDDHGYKGLDSFALSANSDAMRLLAEHGRITITSQYGRRVIGRWVYPK